MEVITLLVTNDLTRLGYRNNVKTYFHLKKSTMEKVENGIDLIYPYSDNRSAAVKYNDLGLQKYLQVEFDDAIADYTKAIELDPKFAVAYFNRGTVYYRLGYYESALKDLVKSVNLEPKNPEFLEALSDCRKMLEEEENAPPL